MLRAILKSRWAARTTLLAVLAVAVTGLWGCGKTLTGYDDPNAAITTTQTATALIEAATLRQWMDEGKVNNPDRSSRDRVVILTVASAAQYGANHIPGALLLNSSTDLNMARLEGVGAIGTMVLDGASIDEIVQRSGIDQYTTIVFTAASGQNYLNASRAYFQFRYWGFPKERLKMLQSGDDGWAAAGYALTTAVPSVSRTAYSVTAHYARNPNSLNCRASIGQMIDVVDRINSGALSATSADGVAILDVRGGIDPMTGPCLSNAILDDWNAYHVSGQSSTFKPTAELVAQLESQGVTAARSMTYVYCASGVRASSVFFILDGILGWPVSMYDGSTNQWLGYRTANGVGTAWRIDANSPNTALPRTFGTPAGTMTVDPTANALYTNILDPRANQIRVEDQAYYRSGAIAGGGSGGGGGGGGSPSGC